MPPARRLVSTGCERDPPRQSVSVSGCALPELRLLLFERAEPDTCAAEDPAGPGGDVGADPSVTTIDPRAGEAALVEAPLGVPVALVAQCRDEGGVVRRWGCDDDLDDSLSVVVGDVLAAGCSNASCPAGSRSWSGGGGQVCVALEPPGLPCLPGDDAGACECRPGERDLDPCMGPQCTSRERLCEADCRWGGWGECVDRGCDDGDPCTTDACALLACTNEPCAAPEVCCEGGCHAAPCP